MNNIRLALGARGEERAARYLKKNGYKVLERNYRTALGELDIIAFDKKEKTTVFIEVKTKTSDFFGLPREMVDEHKQRKIEQMVAQYINKNSFWNEPVRIDVIEVLDDEVVHIKNAW